MYTLGPIIIPSTSILDSRHQVYVSEPFLDFYASKKAQTGYSKHISKELEELEPEFHWHIHVLLFHHEE